VSEREFNAGVVELEPSQTTSDARDAMVQAQTGVTDVQENMEALKHNFFLSRYFNKRGYEDSADLAANEIERLPADPPTKTVYILIEAALRVGQKSSMTATWWSIDCVCSS
jgi:hypothetical protein